MVAYSGNGAIIVHITETGNKYHQSWCRYLRQSDNEIALEDAYVDGYEQCSVCNPPQYTGTAERKKTREESKRRYSTATVSDDNNPSTNHTSPVIYAVGGITVCGGMFACGRRIAKKRKIEKEREIERIRQHEEYRARKKYEEQLTAEKQRLEQIRMQQEDEIRKRYYEEN